MSAGHVKNIVLIWMNLGMTEVHKIFSDYFDFGLVWLCLCAEFQVINSLLHIFF
jgi:hypothetical protein